MMKRNLYIQMAMVAAALITAGCSSDDDAAETAPELRAISFTGGVNTEEVQTSRAEDEGLEDYSHQFIVYGYKNGNSELVMNGYAVNWIETSAGTTTSNTHDWEYVGQGTHADHPQVIKYWDETAENYSFFGFVPARTTDKNAPEYYETEYNTPTGSYNPQILFRNLSYCAEFEGKFTYVKGFNPDGSPEYSVPLDKTKMPLISKMSRITGSEIGKPVRMEFIPPYARVKIAFQRISTVENTPISGITFKPQSEKVTVPSKATVVRIFDPKNGATSTRLVGANTEKVFEGGIPFDALSKTETTKVEGEEDVTTLKGIMEKADEIYYANPYYMLFPTPADGTPDNFVLSAWIGSGWQSCVVPAAYMKWEMGYEYTYVFKITKAGLNLINVIKVGIKTWESIGTKDTKFHNW